MTRLFRRGAGERGQSMVEFALAVPIFILVLVGVFDLGRAVYAYSTLNNAAREAARVAIVDQTLTHIRDQAVDAATGVGVSGTAVSVDYRLASTPNAPNSCNANLGKDSIYGCIAVVRVPHQFVAATPMVSQLVGTISLAGESRFPVEHNCREPDKPKCPVAQ